MSLLDEAMESCVRLNKTTEDDGYGEERTVWTEGSHFEAAIVFDNSTEARIAQAAGVKNLYTVTTRKDWLLEFHDVFKRLSDNKIFRVTSDGTDKKTPASAGLNMRQVNAEEWTPTNG